MKFVSALSPLRLFRRASAPTRCLLRDERGMSTVEYVILLAVIVVGAIGTWKIIGTHVGKRLDDAKTEILKI